MLRSKALSFRIGKKNLLYPTTLAFESGFFHVIMGANGAGKSTLLKLLAGDMLPSSGSVFLQEKPLSYFSKKELSQKRAVLSQHYHIAFPVNVQDVVLMGRYPYFGAQPSAADKDICAWAMHTMAVAGLAHRDYATLSGGEAQKVQMSRVLAQIGNEEANGKVLLLDEPVSHLDIRYQQQLLKAAKELCNKGVTVVAVLHDINLAIHYADHILFMKGGNIVYDVNSAGLVSAAMIKDVFDVDATILHREGEKPLVVF